MELVATRAGAAYLKKNSLETDDPHSQGANPISHSTHGAHTENRSPALASTASTEDSLDKNVDEEAGTHDHHHAIDSTDSDALSQLIGVLILEFGE